MIISIVLLCIDNIIKKIPHIFNSLSREGVLQRLEKISTEEEMKKLKLVYLQTRRKSIYKYSIDRLFKEKRIL